MPLLRRSFLLVLVGVLALGGLTACGGGPLDVDAAADLLPKALEKGKALQEKLLAIDSAEAATAAKPALEPLVTAFSEMMAKLVPVKALLKGGLAKTWNEVDAIAASIRAKAATWAADADGTGGQIVQALGGGPTDRIMDLAR
ncbi:MAG: hypothetical protein R3F05_05420 [Planctomycetota bacterium]